MEETQFDADTGELFSTSEAAIIAAKSRMEAEEDELLGKGQMRLMSAMMAAVEKLPAWITTDKKGAHNIKYATLKQILETVRPHLHAQGLRIRQGVDRSYPLDDGHGVKGRIVTVYTDLVHAESGEVDRTIVEIPLIKMDPQSMGSAITYGRRYSLLAALGLATDEADDDGETATAKKITDRVQQSSELLGLLKEIGNFKSASDLAEWGHDPKQTKRLNRLDDAERALAHKAYEERSQQLLDALDDEPAPKKGGKA